MNVFENIDTNSLEIRRNEATDANLLLNRCDPFHFCSLLHPPPPTTPSLHHSSPADLGVTTNTLLSSKMIEDVILLSGGDLSADVAEQIASKLSSSTPIEASRVHKVAMSKSKEFKDALLEGSLAKPSTLAIFIAQTIENELPTEDAGACIRFFKRKTHPDTLFKDKPQFAVLGLGDSNLLLDRQHTNASDCNQVAQALDARLQALGGERFCQRGECDERTGLLEVEPWIDMMIEKIKECL